MENKIDKVLQAERKLQGLCQLCGCKPQPVFDTWKECRYAKDVSFDTYPEECLDKITYYKEDRRLEEEEEEMLREMKEISDAEKN